MKYLYLTSDFLGSWALASALLHQAPRHHMTAMIVSTAPRGWRHVVRLVRRSGLGYTARGALISRGYKAIQALGPLWFGRAHAHDSLLSLDRVAASHQVPILRIPSINSPESVALINSFHPDVIVSVFFNQRLCRDVLKVPRLGCINLHNSILPKYAGIDSSFHAVANGETVVGSSVHFMEERFDSGPVIGQYQYTRHPDETVLHLDYVVMKEGIKIAAMALDECESGIIRTTAQNPSFRTYCSYSSRKEVEQFKRTGGRYFLWREVVSLCFEGEVLDWSSSSGKRLK